jgi:poly(A) polymerase
LGTEADDALRLSRAEAQTLERMRDGMAGTGVRESWAFRHGARLARDILLLRGAMPDNRSTLPPKRSSRPGRNAVFPVKAADLMPEFSGPALGAELVAAGKTLDRKRFRHDGGGAAGLSRCA